MEVKSNKGIEAYTYFEKYRGGVIKEAYGWMSISALENQIAQLQAEVDRRREASRRRREESKGKPKVPRMPEWCKAPWERKDGKSHIVYGKFSRRKGGTPMEGYWLWENGKPIRCSSDKAGCAWMASNDNISVWDPSEWEEYKSKHPEIDEERAKYVVGSVVK